MSGKYSKYPVLGIGTTNEDLEEVLWVLQHQLQTKPLVATWVDLELHLANINPASTGMNNIGYDDIPLSQLSAAKKIKGSRKAVTATRKKTGSYTGTITDNKHEAAKKQFVDDWKGFLEDAKATHDKIDWLCEGLESLFVVGRDQINNHCGSDGGGRGNGNIWPRGRRASKSFEKDKIWCIGSQQKMKTRISVVCDSLPFQRNLFLP